MFIEKSFRMTKYLTVNPSLKKTDTYLEWHRENVFLDNIHDPNNRRGCLRGVMVKVMDCEIVVREFVFQ